MIKFAFVLAFIASVFSAGIANAQSHFDDSGDTIGARVSAASSRPVKAEKPKAAKANKVAADGFYFEHASEARENVKISLVLYPSLEALNAAKDEIGVQMKLPPRPANVTVHAFSVMMGAKCEIHMVDPKISYQPEYYGHELMHCMFPEHFHPTQDSAEG